MMWPLTLKYLVTLELPFVILNRTEREDKHFKQL